MRTKIHYIPSLTGLLLLTAVLVSGAAIIAAYLFGGTHQDTIDTIIFSGMIAASIIHLVILAAMYFFYISYRTDKIAVADRLLYGLIITILGVVVSSDITISLLSDFLSGFLDIHSYHLRAQLEDWFHNYLTVAITVILSTWLYYRFVYRMAPDRQILNAIALIISGIIQLSIYAYWLLNHCGDMGPNKQLNCSLGFTTTFFGYLFLINYLPSLWLAMLPGLYVLRHHGVELPRHTYLMQLVYSILPVAILHLSFWAAWLL